MILSASRRTDIPAHFSPWFFGRLKEGFVCVRNPMNFHQVSRISLSPEVVDGIVFWTKNPIPMMDKLDLLQDYPFCFQFTLTAYGQDLEPGIPSKNDTIIPAFRELSKRIGPERMLWRYDPILLTPKYTAEYHIHYFEELCRRLDGCTEKCIISFVDSYRHLGNRFQTPCNEEIMELAAQMAEIGHRHRLSLEACAEVVDLSSLGIGKGHCIDKELMERLIGQPLSLTKDKNQREHCGCMASIDIGMYDTCPNGCRYCYANHSPAAVARNLGAHDPSSPLLCGHLLPEDTVKNRAVRSCKQQQMTFY